MGTVRFTNGGSRLSIVTPTRRKVRVLVSAVAAALVVASTLAVAPSASAAPVGCTSDLYVATSSATITKRAPDGTITTIPTGTLTVQSIALNPADGNLYALSSNPAVGNHLFRVEADGSSTDLGAASGLPGGATYPTLAFDSSGTAWVSSATLYKIDITSMTATTLPLVGGGVGGDIAFVDGELYAWAPGNRIAHVNTTTGVVTLTLITGFAAMGAAWSSDGHLYAGQGTNIREVIGYNTATPTLTTVATLPAVGGDGASCASAPSPFLAALDDNYTSAPIAPSTGGTTATVFSNDVASGAAITPASVTATLTSDGGLTGATLAPDGTITVPSGEAAGAYTLQYQLCLASAPTVCDLATATILLRTPTVTVPPATTPSKPTLAVTGVDPVPPVVIGGLAITLGLFILVLTRRFRRRATTR